MCAEVNHHHRQWLIAIGLIVGSILEERHYRKQRQKNNHHKINKYLRG